MAAHRIYEIGGKPLILAHRGGAGEQPENSSAAFAAAYAAGFRHFETDTRSTKDGVAVVFHDETLERTTDGIGAVYDYTWAELSKVRDASGARLMRLDELLDAYPDVIFNIDVKSDYALEPLVSVIEKAKVHSRVCIASFSQRRIRRVQKALPGVATSMSLLAAATFVGAAHLPARMAGGVSWILPSSRRGTQALQVPTVRNGVRVVDETFVNLAHRRGQAVHVWTINEPAEVDRLLSLGVDGFVTDVPTTLAAHLRSRGIEPEL